MKQFVADVQSKGDAARGERSSAAPTPPACAATRSPAPAARSPRPDLGRLRTRRLPRRFDPPAQQGDQGGVPRPDRRNQGRRPVHRHQGAPDRPRPDPPRRRPGRDRRSRSTSQGQPARGRLDDARRTGRPAHPAGAPRPGALPLRARPPRPLRRLQQAHRPPLGNPHQPRRPRRRPNAGRGASTSPSAVWLPDYATVSGLLPAHPGLARCQVRVTTAGPVKFVLDKSITPSAAWIDDAPASPAGPELTATLTPGVHTLTFAVPPTPRTAASASNSPTFPVPPPRPNSSPAGEPRNARSVRNSRHVPTSARMRARSGSRIAGIVAPRRRNVFLELLYLSLLRIADGRRAIPARRRLGLSDGCCAQPAAPDRPMPALRRSHPCVIVSPGLSSPRSPPS